jgi:hypothetical protein
VKRKTLRERAEIAAKRHFGFCEPFILDEYELMAAYIQGMLAGYRASRPAGVPDDMREAVERALAVEATDYWPTDQQIGWDKCREHIRAAIAKHAAPEEPL